MVLRGFDVGSAGTEGPEGPPTGCWLGMALASTDEPKRDPVATTGGLGVGLVAMTAGWGTCSTLVAEGLGINSVITTVGWLRAVQTGDDGGVLLIRGDERGVLKLVCTETSQTVLADKATLELAVLGTGVVEATVVGFR